ncbi:MAG TPA: PsbP-related protein [Nitrososphaeraceae archaeon]|nr:PsbP-related protein [Nitrososphaeraceae archaeon]
MNQIRTDVLIIVCFAAVFVFVGVLVSSTMIIRAHAQLQTTTNTTNTKATTFLTYKDKQGRFTISYPSSGWEVTPAKNRFEDFVVSFRNLDTLSSLVIQLNKIDYPGNDVESLMSAMPDMARIGTPNFELIQEVECKKYTIDGHKACSMINTQTPDYISEKKIAMMTVGSIINGTSYMFLYGAKPDNFDTYLPIIDKMIGSFKITANATTTTTS